MRNPAVLGGSATHGPQLEGRRHHSAAGGVGLLLTRIAKLRGASVVAAVSTLAKAQVARENGAETTSAILSSIAALTGGVFDLMMHEP